MECLDDINVSSNSEGYDLFIAGTRHVVTGENIAWKKNQFNPAPSLKRTLLTWASKVPHAWLYVIQVWKEKSFELKRKNIFPAIHECNAVKCLTYPRFENGGKNSVFTVILQLSKWQVVKVSEESRSHRVSTTPWGAHCCHKVDIH